MSRRPRYFPKQVGEVWYVFDRKVNYAISAPFSSRERAQQEVAKLPNRTVLTKTHDINKYMREYKRKRGKGK